jgi:nicotinamidase/pyrazinamidase
VLILRKGRHKDVDSYSAFFENDRVTATGLEYYLRGHRVGKVYLNGLAQDICVYYSAKGALRLGFDTFMIEDAARGSDLLPGSLAEKMAEPVKAGMHMIRSVDVQ